MGRPKGGKNRRWTKEEKLKIVLRYIDDGVGRTQLTRESGISKSQLHSWITKYTQHGVEGLENKKKTGNLYSALHNSKSLTEVERLRLLVAKQEVEIERLKKGYQVKGVGANKEFVSLRDPSTKS